jgi:uncharacterized membrane protein
MAQKTIAALFDNVENAARAIRHLHAADIEPLEVGIVVSNPDNRCLEYLERPSHRGQDDGDVKVGAILGSILGVGAGLLTGLTLIAVPGLGPVAAAGWLIAGLTGAGAVAGAAVGALAGTLGDEGISAEQARGYEEGVRRGGTLVMVRTDETNIEQVVQILDQEGAIDMDERMSIWRSEGWTDIAGSTT